MTFNFAIIIDLQEVAEKCVEFLSPHSVPHVNFLDNVASRPGSNIGTAHALYLISPLTHVHACVCMCVAFYKLLRFAFTSRARHSRRAHQVLHAAMICHC